MYKIRIKNLRSLKDTGDLDIKPLTIVVGKNSSGKSTLLRFFPLMKQTLETRRNEPILWYSNSYVDFGSFEEALNKKEVNNDNNIPIIFSISFDIKENEFKSIGRYINSRDINKNKKKQITINLSIKKDYIDNIKISIDKNNIEINFKNKAVVDYINLNKTKIKCDNIFGYYFNVAKVMLPDLININKEDKSVYPIRSYFINLIYNRMNNEYFKENNDSLKRFIDSLNLEKWDLDLDNIGNHDLLKKIIESLNLENSDLDLDSIGNNNLLKKFIEFTKSDTIIQDYILGSKLDNILDLCNTCLYEKFINVEYIAPIRANAERYYRVQGLAINQIDPRGENIAMLLYNLNEADKKEFSSWVETNFGFGISTHLEGGHVRINVQHKENCIPINLVDTGFGYSQILPIIVQLWRITKEKSRRTGIYAQKTKSHILVIEQPELHLHPAMQANLVDAFVKVLDIARKNKIDFRILIETHSETIVNRVGYLISEKKFNCNDNLVNLLIFNKKDEYESEIIKSGYDNEGYLEKWPMGFFNPEV